MPEKIHGYIILFRKPERTENLEEINVNGITILWR